MDVLDFLIVLSPEDKFDFFVRPDAAGGRPVVEWGDDETCVVGPPRGAQKVTFPVPVKFPDGTDMADVDDFGLGHMEVIGMFAFNDAPWAQDCNAMSNQLTNPEFANPRALDPSTGKPYPAGYPFAYYGGGDAPDELIGRFIVRGVGRGVEVGGNATPIKDTFTGPFYAAQSAVPCNASNVNSASVEDHPCVSMYNWDTQWFDHPHLGDMLRVGPWKHPNTPLTELGSSLPRKIDSELRAYALQGDWASADANNVLTQWVVSFPTKYIYTDYRPNLTAYQWVLVNPHRRLPTDQDPELVNAPFDDLQTWVAGNPPTRYPSPPGDLCLHDNQWTFWDTDENPVTVLSPFAETFPICNEVNIYNISSVSSLKDKVPLFPFGEDVPVEAIIDGENVERGWAELMLNWPRINGRPVPYGWGAATVGYDVIQRATDNAAQNNGTLSDLARRVNPGSPYGAPN